jgi:hypothetical protein
VARPRFSGDVGVSGERVTYVYGVAALGVERAPRLVRHAHAGKGDPGSHGDVSDIEEATLPDGTPLPPGTAGRRGTVVGERPVGR